MIPRECKRLAEVDFPIAVVSAHSAREKGIHIGHPAVLHLWWARKPLAACRAMLLALLLPDPCDDKCPADFKASAREHLARIYNKVASDDAGLRRDLLKFIGDFSNWDNAAVPRYLEVGRGLVKAAHGDEAPLVVDPFAGGGSVPLEALRLGCDTFASDLNPVACVVLKVLLEDIPRQGPKLAEELRRVRPEIRKRVEEDLQLYYPSDPSGSTPIAYLWARTVICESPNCGAEIPLVRSFWLSKKPPNIRAVRLKIRRLTGEPPSIEFEVFTPKNEREVPGPTVTRAAASCPACGTSLAPDRVRAQLRRQHGGADTLFDDKGNRLAGARLLAVVTVNDSAAGRQYRVATDGDYTPVWGATRDVVEMSGGKLEGGLTAIPNEPTPPRDGHRAVASARVYGIDSWADVFTARQKMLLATFESAVRSANLSPGGRALCALAVDRLVMQCSAHCRWKASGPSLVDMFGRHTVGMEWSFAESCPTSKAADIFGTWLSQFALAIDRLAPLDLVAGQVSAADAANHPLPSGAAAIWLTDPPYYDAVPYAYLADCFYVWMRRLDLHRHGYPFFANSLSPTESECVADHPRGTRGTGRDATFFEARVRAAAAEGRRLLHTEGIGAVIFAHRTTEGWESLLSGLVSSGWQICASWPIATELGSRLNAHETASLATSISLVCRPRSDDAGVGDWGDVLRQLPNRIGEWMERLTSEGVRGADLVFACIGPAMELYSRYSRVEDAEGREIQLGGDPEAVEPYKRGFLAYVWETVGRIALEQILGTAEARARNGAAGALDEDARLTALFLWTIQSTATNGADAESGEKGGSEEGDEEAAASKSKKGLTLVYDVTRRFAQPLGIHLDRWENRIIVIEKGIVRLLPVIERAEQLLGEDGAIGAADIIERTKGKNINYEFAFASEVEDPPTKPKPKTRKAGTGRDEAPAPKQGTTTLDHVHIAMLLQKSGKSNALRTMLKSEIERSPDFLRLANALSALYPKDSEEKRLLDAMLLAAPR